MSQQEIKGNLARLLATENLVVEHRTVDTASFDVERRVLTLPNWDRASSVVYDMLVGHEVGHALYTPNIEPPTTCPQDYINVVEDVRIEKLMKRKYPGLTKSFYLGYGELNANDFFGVSSIDYEELQLIDRINLNYKVGASAMIPFSDEEKVFVTRSETTETFDEVCTLSQDIYEYVKAQQEELNREEVESLKGAEQGGAEEGNNEDSDEEFEVSQSGKGSKKEVDDMTDEELLEELNNPTSGNAGGEHSDIEKSKTQRAFDESSEELNSPNLGRPISYIEIPDKLPCKLDRYIADWEKVHAWIDQNVDENAFEKADEDQRYIWGTSYDKVDQEYREFRKQSQKEVNYLVKEFECRKSADNYARTGSARTGVLDTKKLHTYQFNEDLFKRINVVPDGKNHGLIFILDWSGSMQNEIFATVKQLLNLTAFCKKVQIPFEVYAFTNEWEVAERAMCNEKEDYQELFYSYDYRDHEGLERDKFYINPRQFTLMNFISSRSNGKNYERMCKNIWREAYSITYSTRYRYTPGLNLSGTPLNEAIVMMNYVVPQFKKDNDLQKVNVCILSDGEACGSQYGKQTFYEHRGEEVLRPYGIDYDVCLRDRNTGRVYNPFNGYTMATVTLIEQVRDRNAGVNVIGIRLLNGRDLSSYVGRYATYEHYEDVQRQWKKEKSAIIPEPKGYTALYAISNKDLDGDTEFDVAEDATKGQITKAFKKMLKKKSTNKKLLNSFVAHVA